MSAVKESRQVYRSTAALVAGWAWMVFAAANLVDIAIRGRDLASLIATAVLLTGCGVAYILGIRPRVTADDAGVNVRNPLRDADLPWPGVTKIDVADTVRIHHTAGLTRVWALPSSPRSRARAAHRAARDSARLPDAIAKEIKGRTPTTFAVEQLTDLWKHHPEDVSEAPDPRVTWSPPAVAATALPATFLLITILIAVF